MFRRAQIDHPGFIKEFDNDCTQMSVTDVRDGGTSPAAFATSERV